MLTHLSEAIGYALTSDACWAFHHIMSTEDRKAFDNMLVDTKHPLSYEPGTTEGRWYRYIADKRRLITEAMANSTYLP